MEDSKPLLLDDDSSHKESSPLTTKNGTDTIDDNNEDVRNKLNSTEQKGMKLEPSKEHLTRSKSHGRSVLLRKATLWRRRSKQSLASKNEDRERKATETLAIVLGKILLYFNKLIVI